MTERERTELHTLAVCRTCPRAQAAKNDMIGRLRDLPIPSGMRVLSVECLGGCPWPSAVALNAPDKWRLRLTRLRVTQAGDLLHAARVYLDSADGNLADDHLPPSLRGHISARSPCHPKRSDAALSINIMSRDGATP